MSEIAKLGEELGLPEDTRIALVPDKWVSE
jgi:hypothetical protein